MTQLYQARLRLPEALAGDQLQLFETVFSELLDAEATSHLRVGPGGADGDWLIEAIFTFDPDASVIDDLLAAAFAQLDLAPVPVEVEALAQRDWLAENRAAFPPRQIGRFWIYGGHVDMPPPAASWPLLVEAAQAFGSGTHPTTEGCMRAFEAILRRHPNRRWNALDMGCGSAILALGALRARPASRFVAADNDILAVRTAAQNARINRIPRTALRAVLSTGYGNRTVRQTAPYDLIFANILAGPLCRMAGDQLAALAPGGWLILSGILTHQATMVARRYAAHGGRCVDRLQIGEWTTLVMTRGSGPGFGGAGLGRAGGLWHPDRHRIQRPDEQAVR